MTLSKSLNISFCASATLCNRQRRLEGEGDCGFGAYPGSVQSSPRIQHAVNFCIKKFGFVVELMDITHMSCHHFGENA